MATIIGGNGNKTIAFSDGSAILALTGLNKATLGGKTISTTSSALSGITLNTMDKSSSSPVSLVSNLSLMGTNSDDSLTGGSGDDLIPGLGGNDLLTGGDGRDCLIGGAGADVLIGGSGNDILLGGDDGDRLNGGLGDDYIDGGADGRWDDIVDYRLSPSAVVVNLTTGTASGEGNDTLIDIEHIYDSPYGDTLIGNDELNVFKLSGGNDTVDGAGGYNFVWYSEVPTGVNATIDSSGSGTATDFIASNHNIGTDTFTHIQGIVGTNSADRITISTAYGVAKGRMGDDTLVGGIGSQTFIGGSGNDTMDGGDGFDTVSYVDDGFDSVFNPLLTTITPITTHGVQVDLSTGIVTDNWGNIDRLLNIEAVEGSSFTDTLIGGNTADTFIFGPSVSLANISPDIIRNYESDKDTLVFTLPDNSPAPITLAVADASITIAGSNVQVSNQGLISFNTADNAYELKVAAIQNDSALDFPNQVALFTSGSDSYVYYSGASIGNSDDQIIKLSDKLGTRLNLDATQKTVTVSTNVLVPVPLVHQGRTVNQFRNSTAFAAIKMDGSVITWGDFNSGGDSSSVEGVLNGDINVKQLYSKELLQMLF